MNQGEILEYHDLPYQIILEITRRFYLYELPIEDDNGSSKKESISGNKKGCEMLFGRFQRDRMRKVMIIFCSLLVKTPKKVRDVQSLGFLPVKNLIHIEFSNWVRQRRSISFLYHCRNLESLHKIVIHETNFPKLKYPKMMKSLSFAKHRLTNELVRFVNSFTELKWLFFNSDNFSNKEILEVDLHLRNLKHLHFYRLPPSITFSRIRNISVIIISRSSVSNSQLNNILNHCGQLKKIKFSKTILENNYYKLFTQQKNPNLSSITFYLCFFDTSMMENVRFRKGMAQVHQLRSILISRCRDVKDRSSVDDKEEEIPFSFLNSLSHLKKLKLVDLTDTPFNIRKFLLDVVLEDIDLHDKEDEENESIWKKLSLVLERQSMFSCKDLIPLLLKNGVKFVLK